MQSSLLGSGGHGVRRKPTLEAQLHIMRNTEMAAPYMNHIGLAAPYLAAAPPEVVPGLLLPTIGSVKPPAARKAPTRVNLFKAQATLSLSKTCNDCPILDGTIVVTHFGSVPPRTYLCHVVKFKKYKYEALVPFKVIEYQVAPSSQFTYATNAASSITLEITSFAAANPLNGQATSAHVMDIDDINVYSSGSYELRSTTPKDSLNSVSLARGIVGIMGPESFTETLIHPYHPGTKTYPGWSIRCTNQTPGVEFENDTFNIPIQAISSHRWWTETTITANVCVTFNGPLVGGGTLKLYAQVVKGKCVEVEECRVGLTDPSVENNCLGTAQLPIVTATPEKVYTKLTMPAPQNGIGGPIPDEAHVTGMYTVKEDEQLVAIVVDWFPKASDAPSMKSFDMDFRTLCQDAEHQFGPAIVTRLQGLTQDIIIQANVRSAVAGIQSGDSRSVAPPTTPSLMGLGEEDVVLAQAMFDDPSTALARVMNTAQYSNLADTLPCHTRENAINRLEAAPIGDTIRGIGSTLSNIANAVGLKPIGSILGTLGNIGGGIGDAIFAAPAKRPRTDVYLAAPVSEYMAAPLDTTSLWNAYGELDMLGPDPAPAMAVGATDSVKLKSEASKHIGWSSLFTNMSKGHGLFTQDSYQAFPYAIPDQPAGGIATIYLSSGPVRVPGRPTVRYYRITPKAPAAVAAQSTFVYNIDEYLVTHNERSYINELLQTLITLKRGIAYVTTDADSFIYGDSMSAALLVAGTIPIPEAAVTGSVQFIVSGGIRVKPVGRLETKAEVCLANGLVLVCPDERATRELRTSTAGTEVAHIADIQTGKLIQSPKIIIVENLSDLITAACFIRASASIPLSADEAALKEEAKQKSLKGQALRDENAANYARTPDTTQQAITALEAMEFPVDLPGFGIVPAKLLSAEWWNEAVPDLFKPAGGKGGGMGVKAETLTKYINAGDIPRLTGLAMGGLSREMSKARKAGGQKKTKASRPAPRLPPYKRPSSQISQLITSLRNRQTPPAPGPQAQMDTGESSS